MKYIIIILVAALTGCAQVSAVRVTSENPNPRGYPFYGQKPIMIVSGNQATVKTIPNLNERYALQMHAFLAKNHTKLVLNDDGTLKSVDANLDTTAAITLFENLADKIIPEGPAKSGETNSQGTTIVYEFVFHDDGSLSLRQINYSKLAYVHSAASSASGQNGTASEGGSVQSTNE